MLGGSRDAAAVSRLAVPQGDGAACAGGLAGRSKRLRPPVEAAAAAAREGATTPWVGTAEATRRLSPRACDPAPALPECALASLEVTYWYPPECGVMM